MQEIGYSVYSSRYFSALNIDMWHSVLAFSVVYGVVYFVNIVTVIRTVRLVIL